MPLSRTTKRVLIAGLGIAALAGVAATAAMADAWSGHWRGHHDGPRAGMMFDRMQTEMDADKNGTVTRAEIEAFHAARAKEIDANNDGQITAAELQAFRDKQRERRMAEMLKTMDKDGDGKVSVAEFEAAQSWRMARFDRNGDGAIDRMDMMRGYGPHRPSPDRR